jgi:hypothetical protein
MDHPPPLPLNYGNPDSPPPGMASGAKFAFGLLGGTMISAVVWPCLWLLSDPNNGNWGWLLLAVPLAKIAVSTVCLCRSRWRATGAGILTSIGVGFLIFFGTCAANLDKLKI